MTGPDVRVVDASLHGDQGPIRVVVTGLDRADEVLDAVSHAGANASLDDGRLTVVGKSTQLVDAAGRTGGADLAEPLRERLDSAIAAWAGRPAALTTPAGDLPLDQRPLVMGVVNVTPDSFSDGGAYADEAAAVAHGEALIAAGADVLDVGGESTRPSAEPVDADTELARVLPVVRGLVAAGAVVSIDTTKAQVAQEAVDAGAAIVNDISAGRLDPELVPTVAKLGVPYVLMHMLGTPRTMQDDPTYHDVVAEVFEFLAEQLARLEQAGIDRDRVLVDPGIGFGKTTADNLELLAHLRQFTSLGCPVVVGASRKRFLGELTSVDEPADRVVSSAAAAALAVARGAAIVRAHDVAETVEAVRVAAAIAAADRPSAS